MTHAVWLYQVTAMVLGYTVSRPRGFDDCNMILELRRRAWETKWVLKVAVLSTVHRQTATGLALAVALDPA